MRASGARTWAVSPDCHPFQLMFALSYREAVYSDRCCVCGFPLPYEQVGCCDGRDCGCMGMPVDPPLCGGNCDEIGTKRMDEPTAASLEANVF